MPHVRSTKFSLAVLVALVTILFAANPSGLLAHAQSAVRSRAASLSPTLSVSSNLVNRRYAAAGDRAYDLGSEDGRYPAMGFHTRGEMGGIWTPPIKLLDATWFATNAHWIWPPPRFPPPF